MTILIGIECISVAGIWFRFGSNAGGWRGAACATGWGSGHAAGPRFAFAFAGGGQVNGKINMSKSESTQGQEKAIGRTKPALVVAWDSEIRIAMGGI